jgi:uncharacterized protein DUF2703
MTIVGGRFSSDEATKPSHCQKLHTTKASLPVGFATARETSSKRSDVFHAPLRLPGADRSPKNVATLTSRVQTSRRDLAQIPVAAMKRTLKTLPIVWQRLVKEGSTCPRCGGTLREIERAMDQLAVFRWVAVQIRIYCQFPGGIIESKIVYNFGSSVSYSSFPWPTPALLKTNAIVKTRSLAVFIH